MNTDEIQKYVQGRYIGPTEAVWRLFEYSTHKESPTVMHLSIQLLGEQPVYFAEWVDANTLRIQMETARTTLMACFKYNADNEDGRKYLYQEFPAHYTYDAKEKTWHIRKQQPAIGRIYHCNPFMGEKYYLCLLLTTVRGPQSFEHLRIVHGIQYPTFTSACIALGLLADDNEWVQCFTEAIIFVSGHGLCSLFVTALLYGNITDPTILWNTFAEGICDDLKSYLSLHPDIVLQPDLPDIHLDYDLHLLQTALAQYGKRLTDFHMPTALGEWERTAGNSLITEELRWNRDNEAVLARERILQLNLDQKTVFDTVIFTVEKAEPKVFFLQEPAGTGKTHVYKTICNYLQAQGKIVLCCTSFGIAALLLPVGRTSHSRFKIPLDITESSTCNISHNTQLTKLITKTDLIIWDEVPMQHKYYFEVVSGSLNDLRGTGQNTLFGNIPVLLGGDFAQILPVVRRGNRAQTVTACLQQSHMWRYLTV